MNNSMHIAVLDCPKGIAGTITVGALLDLGVPFALFKKEIEKLGRLPGYSLSLKETEAGADQHRRG